MKESEKTKKSSLLEFTFYGGDTNYLDMYFAECYEKIKLRIVDIECSRGKRSRGWLL